MQQQDEKYMRRCLELARLSEYYVAPNPMVGAVLVDEDGTILAEGWHQQYGGPHAEVNCFLDAERRGVTEDQIHRSTLYVSLEPCSHYGKTPPCAELIQRKRPRRVVAGILDPNPQVSGRGMEMVRAAGIEAESGLLETECRWLNRRFLCLQEKKRPYVVLKWAQTSDGFLDNRDASTDLTAEPRPLVISSPVTKQLVHKMRAENMAILVGARTVLMDHPKLRTTRWSGRDPLRVALDRHPGGKDYEGWLVYSEKTDWEFVLSDLAQRNVTSVLVEGGRAVLESIIATGIFDEVHIEVGHHPAFCGTPAPKLNQTNCLAKNLFVEHYDSSDVYIYTPREI